MELHGGLRRATTEGQLRRPETASAGGRGPVEQYEEVIGRKPQQRPSSAGSIGRGLRKSPSATETVLRAAASRGASAAEHRRRLQRPASAPAARRPPVRKPKPAPPQVNMNKAGPLGNAPRWSIYGRAAESREAERSPGPGQYDVVAPDEYWCKKKPSISIAHRNSGGHSSKPGPGPAAYSLPSSLGRKGITLGERNSHPGFAPPRAPGPGTYDPQSEPGAGALKKSIGLRVDPPESRSNYPGPGHYKLADQFRRPDQADQPKHAFPLSERKWTLPTGPGPGTYEPVDFMFSKTPACYTFGTKCEEWAETGDRKFTTYSQFA